MNSAKVDFKKMDGLVPVIAQDSETNEILMVAYANEEALNLALSTGYAHYYSRSRKKIWKKGATSGHTQKILEIRIDCDRDSLVYKIKQKGGACHTGYYSCFFRILDEKACILMGKGYLIPKRCTNLNDQTIRKGIGSSCLIESVPTNLLTEFAIPGPSKPQYVRSSDLRAWDRNSSGIPMFRNNTSE